MFLFSTNAKSKVSVEWDKPTDDSDDESSISPISPQSPNKTSSAADNKEEEKTEKEDEMDNKTEKEDDRDEMEEKDEMDEKTEKEDEMDEKTEKEDEKTEKEDEREEKDDLINFHFESEMARVMSIFEYAHPELTLVNYYINVTNSRETSWENKPLSDIEMGATFTVDFVNNDCPNLEVIWTETCVDFDKIQDYKYFGLPTFHLEWTQEECICFKNYWYVVSENKSPFEIAMECGDTDQIYKEIENVKKEIAREIPALYAKINQLQNDAQETYYNFDIELRIFMIFVFMMYIASGVLLIV